MEQEKTGYNTWKHSLVLSSGQDSEPLQKAGAVLCITNLVDGPSAFSHNQVLDCFTGYPQMLQTALQGPGPPKGPTPPWFEHKG